MGGATVTHTNTSMICSTCMNSMMDDTFERVTANDEDEVVMMRAGSFARIMNRISELERRDAERRFKIINHEELNNE